MFYSAIRSSLLSRYFAYAIQVVSLMVLARIFSPREYGVIAAIQVFYVFFQMLGEVGFGPALINLSTISKKEIDGIFFITVLLGAALSVTFFLLGGFFQHFYSIDGVTKVIPFAAGSLFFYTVGIVPTAALNREMRFFRLAQATAVAELVSTIWVVLIHGVADPLKVLASKTIISGATQFVLLYIFCSKTDFGWLSISLRFTIVRKILWFSSYQFFFSFVNYFSRSLDNVLVGHVMGATSLGIYDKAYQLMKYPLMLLTFAMSPAVQPAIRMHRDDKQYVENLHCSFVSKLAWLGLAAGTCLALGAPWIVHVLLGNRWEAVVPIIRELALSVSVQVVLSTSGGFFQAMNRPDLLLLCGLFSSVLIISAILIGIRARDLVLLAWLFSLASNLAFLQCYFVLYKNVFDISPRKFYAKMRPQIILNFLILLIGNPLVLRATHTS